MFHNNRDYLILAQRYAPEVRLSKYEKYFPCDIEWYMSKCELVYPEKNLIISPVTNEDIYQNKLYRTNESPDPTNAYFQIADEIVQYGRVDNIEYSDDLGNFGGVLNNVPVYVNIREDDNIIDLQYYFFYGYNGAIIESLPTFGVHEADWEHITVRLDKNNLNAILMAYYASHGREGRWRTPLEFACNENGHPIVYSSKLLHASYSTAGRQYRIGFGLIDDYTDDGFLWKTWENVILLPHSIDECNSNMYWVFFNGKWGRKVRRLYGENPAPFGPGMKTYFHTGEPL